MFKVTQRDYSVELLKALKAHFKVGKIRLENAKTGSLMYIVTNLEDIKNVIIPFFDENQLITSKNLDYQDWKKAFLLHVETIGNKKEDYPREEIFSIKENMNNRRS